MPEEYTTYKPEWIDKEKQADSKFASFVMTGITKSNEELRRATDATRSARPPKMTIDDYVEGVLAGDRMKLSQAITMVESNAPEHYTMAQDIVQRLLPYTGKAIRVGITGVPGAGKSTIIEALGTKLCQAGHKVAVLAVDPSSSVTGGAILGDKTRMEQLSKEPNAFIRPSPAGGTLGGVTRKSRETMLLAEAAGYDVILVETVGVGQSETTVRSMVDFFLVVVLTGAGDDLQGVKKGVIELADAILVNKADGDNLQKALLTRADYEQILHYLMPATEGWTTKAYTCSAYTGEGIQEIWDVVLQYIDQMKKTGQLDKRRAAQNLTWLKEMTQDYLMNVFLRDPAVSAARSAVEAQVVDGTLAPTKALSLIAEAVDKRFNRE